MSWHRWLVGLFRRFRSFVLGRDVKIVGQCNLCGSCCQDILLYDKGWIRSEREFLRLCEREPEHERFDVVGKDDDGHLAFSCSLLQPDGLCSCHDERLPLCQRYPSEFLYYQGGWVGPHCGFKFKTVTFRDVLMRRKRLRIPKFSEVLEQEVSQSSKRKGM